MVLETRIGNLFDQRDVDALAHGVNCVGRMGAGIAPEFARRFPDMFRAYASACSNGSLQVGGVLPWQLPNGRWVYNLASQHRVGRDARLDAIATSLGAALSHAAAHDVRSVALPRIGAGLGGLAWPRVLEVMTRVGDEHPVTLVVVSLPGA